LTECKDSECPICKGKVSEKARDHVLKEVGHFALDPDYKMQIYDSVKENDQVHTKILAEQKKETDDGELSSRQDKRR